MKIFFLLLAWCLSPGWIFTQELNTHLPLVRKLDAGRVPPGDFTARLTVRKTKAGAAGGETSSFRQYSRRRGGDGQHVALDTLVVCSEPKRDAGKMILFLGDACWFYDPPATRATRLPAQQIAAQAVAADWMNWRFADDFDHKVAGQESLTIAGKSHDCTVLDFTPKPGNKTRSALVRCWIDAAGRPWKAELYTASMKVFRRVLFTKYDTVLGAERAVKLSIENRNDVEEVSMTEVKPAKIPDEYFNPDELPKINPGTP